MYTYCTDYLHRTQQYGGNSSSFSNQVALLPKLKPKAKDNAKSVSFFWERDQSKLCTLFNLTLALALAQIIYKNLSYFPRIVERDDCMPLML